MPDSRFLYPLIYVRGYAGGDDEVEDTVADPYMGFNLGATKLRQRWTGQIDRHYFESPLVRLMKDFGYRDVYEGGVEMPIEQPVSFRSVFIYRYYDQVSSSLGAGIRPELETYAQGLNDLILRVREQCCADGDDAQRKAFRVNLVAHSMGGLVCRCFLQNAEHGSDEARRLVDKVFTYATPHNGIDMRVVGNVPGFFSRNNADNFNRDRMREYLGLSGEDDSVASLNGRFPVDRFFCLIGTNDRDYEVARGWSRRVVGPMSDGLVRIVNASVHDDVQESGRAVRRQAPRAFVHRSHSGHYGIVNSEEGYQNLIRFLFGDVRVDGRLVVNDLSLPPKVQQAIDSGQQVRASYHFESIVRVRGATWDLHRRTVDEESAIFRTYDEMRNGDVAGRPRHPHLFSTYLATSERVNGRRRSLGFSIDLRVLVPRYEIDRRFWRNEHHEGGYLFRDKLNLEAVPPANGQEPGDWRLRYGWDRSSPNRATRGARRKDDDQGLRFAIPVRQRTRPGLDAQLELSVQPWNRDTER